MLKHPYLFSFKAKLIECVKTLDNDQKDLIPEMLIFISKLWSNHNLKIVVLLCTMGELYDWCDKDKWAPLQVQIVGSLSKLFSNDDYQLAEEAMNFWNRILHENINFWKTRPDDIRVVVNSLKKVNNSPKSSNFLTAILTNICDMTTILEMTTFCFNRNSTCSPAINLLI